jgi:hypothetical protein
MGNVNSAFMNIGAWSRFRNRCAEATNDLDVELSYICKSIVMIRWLDAVGPLSMLTQIARG